MAWDWGDILSDILAAGGSYLSAKEQEKAAKEIAEIQATPGEYSLGIDFPMGENIGEYLYENLGVGLTATERALYESAGKSKMLKSINEQGRTISNTFASQGLKGGAVANALQKNQATAIPGFASLEAYLDEIDQSKKEKNLTNILQFLNLKFGEPASEYGAGGTPEYAAGENKLNTMLDNKTMTEKVETAANNQIPIYTDINSLYTNPNGGGGGGGNNTPVTPITPVTPVSPANNSSPTADPMVINNPISNTGENTASDVNAIVQNIVNNLGGDMNAIAGYNKEGLPIYVNSMNTGYPEISPENQLGLGIPATQYGTGGIWQMSEFQTVDDLNRMGQAQQFSDWQEGVSNTIYNNVAPSNNQVATTTAPKATTSAATTVPAEEREIIGYGPLGPVYADKKNALESVASWLWDAVKEYGPDVIGTLLGGI